MTKARRRFGVIAGLWLAFGQAWASATAAPETPVSVDISQGFARVVFELVERPTVAAEIGYGILVIQFSEVINLDTEEMGQALSPYVAKVRQDSDGKTLRLALRGPLRLNESIVGRQYAIDLLPPRWTGDPPNFVGVKMAGRATAEPLSIVPSEARERKEVAAFEKPKAVKSIAVRTGEHPTFSRVVFDWRAPVGYSVEQKGTTVTVRFDDTARVDLSRLRTDPPRYLKTAEAEFFAGRLSVIFELEPTVEVKGFRDGNRIALDFAPRPTDPRPTDDVAFTGPASNDREALAERGQHAAIGAAGTSTAARGETPPSGGDARAVLKDAADEAAADHALPTTETGTETDTETDTGDGSGSALMPDDDEVSHQVASFVVAAEPGRAVVANDSDGVTVTLPWSASVSGAVFRRADTVWMVFDTTEPMAVDGSGPEVNHMIRRAESVTVDGAQVIRLVVRGQPLVEARHADNTWIVRLSEKTANEPDPIVLNREVTASGMARLRLRAEAKTLRWIADPASGDHVVVATVAAANPGTVVERRFVEFEVLPTAAGVALVPFTEDIIAKLDAGDVVVEAAQGLALTATEVIERGPVHSALEFAPRGGYMDFAAWRGAGLSGYTATRQKFQTAIAASDGKVRDLKRLEFARYYLSNGLAAEALGILTLMARDDPRAEKAAAYQALRGVALLNMGQPQKAEVAFSNPALVNDPDIPVWRALAAAAQGKWLAAAQAFKLAEPRFETYVPDLQLLFQLAAAETGLAIHDIAEAERALGAIPAEALDGKTRPQVLYLNGQLLELQGRKDDALQHYRRAARGKRSLYQARASLAETKLLVELGTMTVGEAIKALVALGYDWRGDGLELSTLATLGEFYIADGQYRAGLETMRAAVAHYPDDQVSREVAKSMAKAFKSLFLDGRADEMQPIEALALYYDFRELTPIGREGDDMIRRLAERLVVVDLLPQAGELLRHQVDNRLRGAARSQVATRLAMIYLMDHKAEDALRLIRTTRQAQLPDWLTSQRRLLEARALAALKQYDFALEVLLSDESIDAERIRADVYWGAENWPAAAEAIETVLGDRWRDPKALDAMERFNVMRAAVAYLFSDDAFGLDRLRARYGEAMKAGDDAAAFELVTAKAETQSADLRELTRRIAAIDTLDDFMKSFRARYDPVSGPAIN